MNDLRSSQKDDMFLCRPWWLVRFPYAVSIGTDWYDN